jgi:hypothetical protein
MKKNLWVTTTVLCMQLMGQGLFGQNNKSEPCSLPCNFAQGDESLPNKNCFPSYNLPAGVQLKDSWDVSATASYLYWYAGEQGMDLAVSGIFSGGSVQFPPSQGSVVFQDFKYTSGFKVGLSAEVCSSDLWTLSLDYTYLRPSTHTHASSLSPNVNTLTSWFAQTSSSGQSLGVTSLSSDWHMGLDLLDLALIRPFYEGKKWVVSPFVGLRAAWIRQSLHLEINQPLNASINSAVSKNLSQSWAIGPRVGLGGRFLLGYGLRFDGKLGTSLLFTQYTHVKHEEDPVFLANTPVAYGLSDYNCLRPMMEMGLGFGWGTYFADQRYHFDLSADYEFNYLWEQNMIRYLNDLEILGSGASAGAIYLHGLTLTARFDF